VLESAEGGEGMKTPVRDLVALGSFAALLAACAAAGGEKAPAKSADSPASMQASPSTMATPPTSTYAPPPPMTPSTAPGAGADTRGVALAGATSELESSQRELDVAAGDCRNACRALGSMDRAAGRLCELAQDAEARRCDDAKQKVYSARDRVKNTCGSCPNGPSVERKDPIPSKGSIAPP
jgi:hypothetical protein